MGYVKDTDICQFIPPSLIMKTEGTWTPTLGAGITSENRTAAGGATTLLIPIGPVPGSSGELLGAKIKSVDIWYEVTVAALSAFGTAVIYAQTLPATATAHSVATPAVTLDEDHDTAAERMTAAAHKMNIALDAEVFIADDVAYFVALGFTNAATTVFKLYGAQVNYELKL